MTSDPKAGTPWPATFGPTFETPRSNEQRLSDAIEQLADAILGFRTTRIGQTSITEPIVKRFEQPCTKCQSTDSYVRWHLGDWPTRDQRDQGDAPELFCASRQRVSSATEHLHVTCRICGFEWTTGLVPPSLPPLR